MGIIELHFHESEFEFEFAPSVTNKHGKSPLTTKDAVDEHDVDKIESSDASSMSPDERSSDSNGSSAKRGMAVLAGLAFLVAAGTVAKKLVSRRHSHDDADDHLSTEQVEESIEITD